MDSLHNHSDINIVKYSVMESLIDGAAVIGLGERVGNRRIRRCRSRQNSTCEYQCSEAQPK